MIMIAVSGVVLAVFSVLLLEVMNRLPDRNKDGKKTIAHPNHHI